MARLGAALDWHGALSADVIIGPDGPRFIDINPRLVEAGECPGQRRRPGRGAGRGGQGPGQAQARSEPQPAGVPGVRTHQLLLAVLGAAHQGRRRPVARELVHAVLHRGEYRGSRRS